MPAESRFAFGDNWASYAKLVGEEQIESARQGLLKLLPAASFEGRSFLDIGCGSGLHALAAARLGVRHVLAIDLDQKSVATTEALLARHAGSVPWTVRRADVFDLQPRQHGRYDIVYSWGVLHHTGDVTEALGKAAALVAPGGHFAFALYRPTRLDRLWVAEKRWYAKAGPRATTAGARGLCRAAAGPPRPHGAQLQGSCRDLQGSRHGLRPRRPRLARRLPLPNHKRSSRSRP